MASDAIAEKGGRGKHAFAPQPAELEASAKQATGHVKQAGECVYRSGAAKRSLGKQTWAQSTNSWKAQALGR